MRNPELEKLNNGGFWQLDEIYTENQLRLPWSGGEQSSQYGQPNTQSHEFFQPLECNSTFQTGYNPAGSTQIAAAANVQNVNGLIPGWML
ncbi:unnamed protein product [Ilex paraguariensis]|uniref:Uncharacterized protein n=1 Tax=Ilex paraguariensis TaxID=185542 RepID=A0ABC8STK2_9AQUA